MKITFRLNDFAVTPAEAFSAFRIDAAKIAAHPQRGFHPKIGMGQKGRDDFVFFQTHGGHRYTIRWAIEYEEVFLEYDGPLNGLFRQEFLPELVRGMGTAHESGDLEMILVDGTYGYFDQHMVDSHERRYTDSDLIAEYKAHKEALTEPFRAAFDLLFGDGRPDWQINAVLARLALDGGPYQYDPTNFVSQLRPGYEEDEPAGQSAKWEEAYNLLGEEAKREFANGAHFRNVFEWIRHSIRT